MVPLAEQSATVVRSRVSVALTKASAAVVDEEEEEEEYAGPTVLLQEAVTPAPAQTQAELFEALQRRQAEQQRKREMEEEAERERASREEEEERQRMLRERQQEEEDSEWQAGGGQGGHRPAANSEPVRLPRPRGGDGGGEARYGAALVDSKPKGGLAGRYADSVSAQSGVGAGDLVTKKGVVSGISRNVGGKGGVDVSIEDMAGFDEARKKRQEEREREEAEQRAREEEEQFERAR